MGTHTLDLSVSVGLGEISQLANPEQKDHILISCPQIEESLSRRGARLRKLKV